MKIKTLFNLIRQKLMGDIKWGVKNGLKIGKDCSSMGGGSFGSEPYLITLGDRVRLSSDVSFVTHDGGTWAFRRERGYENVVRYGKIVVGDDTFIGMRSVIMPGVTIGKNCVIGAGSIVTKDVPDRTVVAGVPAKIICSVDEYAKKCIDKMPMEFDKEMMNKNKRKYLEEKYLYK